MASNRNVIEILINADNRQSGPALEKTIRQLNIMAAAATAAFALATREAAKFEQGLAEVSTLMQGDVTQAIQSMDRELKRLAVTSGQTLSSLTRARYDIISAGFTDAGESSKVLEQSVKLATAGLIEAAEAGDILTTALNGMGIAADEVERVSDVLFGTVRLGKTTMTQLAASLGPVFANARLAGVSLEEVGAAMATITASGIDTAEASTALAALLRALAAPAEDAGRQLAVLGITLDKGLGPALEALGKQGELGLDKLKKLIPEIRALNAAAVAGGNIDKFNESLADLQTNSGETETAVEKMSVTLTFLLNQMRSSLQVLGVEIAQSVLPAIKLMARGLTVSFKILNSMPGHTKTTGVVLGALVVSAIAAANAIFVFGKQMELIRSLDIAKIFRFPPKTFNAPFRFLQLTSGPTIGRSIASLRALSGILTAFGGVLAITAIATKKSSDALGTMSDELVELKRAQDAVDPLAETLGEIPSGSNLLESLFGDQAQIENIKKAADEVSGMLDRIDKLTLAFAGVDQAASTVTARFRDLTERTPSELEQMVLQLRTMEGVEGLLAEATEAWGKEIDKAAKAVAKSEDDVQDLADTFNEFNDEIEGAAENAALLREDLESIAKLLPDFEDLEIPLPEPGEISGRFKLALEVMKIDMATFVEEARGLLQTFGEAGSNVFEQMIFDQQKWKFAFKEASEFILRQLARIIGRLLFIRAIQGAITLVNPSAGLIISQGLIHGGVVQGGSSGPVRNAASGISLIPGSVGHDSTLIAASGGESILTESTTSGLRRDLARPGRNSRKGLLQRRGDSGRKISIAFETTRPLNALENIRLIDSFTEAAADAELRGS